MPKSKRSIEERFWSKVNKDGPIPEYAPHLGPCWIWTACTWAGYGEFGIDGRVRKAHTVAYAMLAGSVPKGLVLDHLCRVRNCVRPSHLEPVTQRDNALRGFGCFAESARRTHCPKGHLLDGDNLIKRLLPKRVCLSCKRIEGRERYWRVTRPPHLAGKPRSDANSHMKPAPQT